MTVLRPAGVDDDPALRALLRNLPLEGTIRLTLEREPHFFRAARVEGAPHHVFVGDAGDRLAGLFTRAVRPVWMEGRPARLGYLGQLRKAPGLTLTRRHLRRGFAACETTRVDRELPFDLTSIVTDNEPARRLLERGLPGLPRYTPWTEWTTLVLPSARKRFPRPEGVRQGSPERLPEILDCLRRELSTRQLAPRWTLRDVESSEITPDLGPEDFLYTSDRAGGAPRISGCLALWDQRSFKQAVVRGYAPWLAAMRPFLSPILGLLGRPRLPSPGTSLAMAFLSHEAVPGDRPDLLVRLIEAARRLAPARGIELLVLGLSRSDPRLSLVRRRFPCRVYESVLYLVHRRDPEVRSRVDAVLASSAPPHTEGALL